MSQGISENKYTDFLFFSPLCHNHSKLEDIILFNPPELYLHIYCITETLKIQENKI